ncbi:hypothetical protein BC628DRAFT_1543082 [Trametes gibbosa]|nr:hypothetical protein BC628DRAFT_1543082 [Trametes gibbosa]
MSAIFQNAYYIGNNFNAIFYGVELVVYVATIRALHRPGRASRATDKLLIAFSTILLLLNTVFVATEAVFGEEMWIVNANYPGGSEAYLVAFASVWYQTFGTAASIALNLLSDALLIYRCYVIWGGSFRIVLLPTIIYIATCALGIAQLVASGIPHADYFAGFAQKLGTAYTSTIIALEIIVTTLICVRIRQICRQCGGSSGGTAMVHRYAGAAAVFVESMLLSTLCGIAYLVPFARGDDISIFFLSIYVMSTCLAPQMIIFRMVSDTAWTLKTTEMMLTTTSEHDYDSGHGETMDTARTFGGEATVTMTAREKEQEALGGYHPRTSETV